MCYTVDMQVVTCWWKVGPVQIYTCNQIETIYMFELDLETMFTCSLIQQPMTLRYFHHTYSSSSIYNLFVIHHSSNCPVWLLTVLHILTHSPAHPLTFVTSSTHHFSNLFTHNVLLCFLSSIPSLHQRSQTTTLTMMRRQWRALCLTWSSTIATESTLKGRRLLTRCAPLVIWGDIMGFLLFFSILSALK